MLFFGGLCVAKNRKEALFELLLVEVRLQKDGCRVGNGAADFVVGSNLKREFLFRLAGRKRKARLERARESKTLSASAPMIGSDRVRFPLRGVCTRRLRVPVSTRRIRASASSRSTEERVFSDDTSCPKSVRLFIQVKSKARVFQPMVQWINRRVKRLRVAAVAESLRYDA